MRLKSVLVLLALIIIPSFVFAESGKLARMTGDVKVMPAGKVIWTFPKAGMALFDGDSIKTGAGSAVIALVDGSNLSLKENTQIQISRVAPNAAGQVTVISALMGKLKAAVAKRNEGAGFEVKSPTAVAAVKGTVFIVDLSAGDMSVSVIEGLVALSDLRREREVLIKENERAAMREGMLEKPREMAPEEKKENIDMFKGSHFEGPVPFKEEPALEDKKDDPKDKPLDESKNREGKEKIFEAKDKLFEDMSLKELRKELMELRTDLRDFRDKNDFEQKDDLLERFNDAETGRIATDVHGNRVVVEEYIFHPDPISIEMVNLTKRDGGVTAMNVREVYNQPLPENFMEIKKTYELGTWKQSTVLPLYFLTQRKTFVNNPVGDSILSMTTFTSPLKNFYLEWEQPFNTKFFLNGQMKWSHFTTPSDMGGYFNFQNYWKDAGGVLSGTDTVTRNFIKLGDSTYKLHEEYSDGTYLNTFLFVIDTVGMLASESVFLSTNHPVFTLAELFTRTPLLPIQYELMFASPVFSQPIDSVLSPNMFKEYYRISE